MLYEWRGRQLFRFSVYDRERQGPVAVQSAAGHRVLAAEPWVHPPNVSISLGDKIIDTAKDGLSWPDDLTAYSTVENGRPLVRLPVRFLRINDTLIWSAPVELLCEIAIEVRNQSSFPRTFYFGYTNGWLGYLPTAKAFEEGGYEPKTSPFTNQAEPDVLHGVIAYIQGLRR